MMTDRTAHALRRLLHEDGIELLVQDYFDSDRPFAGSTFDDLGDNPSGAITTDDLLAVTLLDVSFGPSAVRDLLGNPGRWSALLGPLPSGIPLWDMTDRMYDDANTMWQELDSLLGVGPTKAGKLMARKRPGLIPIFDSVIGDFLSGPDLWNQLRGALQDPGLRDGFDALGEGIEPLPSTLRLIDVAIWMRNGESSNARDARARHGLPAEPLRPAVP